MENVKDEDIPISQMGKLRHREGNSVPKAAQLGRSRARSQRQESLLQKSPHLHPNSALIPRMQDTGAHERKRFPVLTHYVPGPTVGTHVNLMTPSSPRLTEEQT